MENANARAANEGGIAVGQVCTLHVQEDRLVLAVTTSGAHAVVDLSVPAISAGTSGNVTLSMINSTGMTRNALVSRARKLAPIALLLLVAAGACHAFEAPVLVRGREEVKVADRTPGDVVSAFASYLTTIKSPNEITMEGVERGTSLRLDRVASGGLYRSGDVGGGWHYFVEYFSGTKTVERTATLEFVNEHDEYADMSPICGTEANAVRDTLKRSGYKEKESMGEIRNFLGWEYTRNDMLIYLVPQAIAGDEGGPRLCIRSIRTMG